MKAVSKAIVSWLALAGLTLGLLAMPALGKTKKSTAKDSRATAATTSHKKKSSKATSIPASASTTANSSPATESSSISAPAAPMTARKATRGNTAAAEGATYRPPPSKGMVWVNENTKVFHREGDRWYGKTKNGKYMTEADAIKAGYHDAKPRRGSKSQQ